jgi:hypothetical protein
LTTQDYVIFASSCSDAITFSNIAQFSYQLLTSKNLFFKPNFKLNRVDSLRIQRDIYYYERKILKKSISYFSFPIDEYLGEK